MHDKTTKPIQRSESALPETGSRTAKAPTLQLQASHAPIQRQDASAQQPVGDWPRFGTISAATGMQTDAQSTAPLAAGEVVMILGEEGDRYRVYRHAAYNEAANLRQGTVEKTAVQVRNFYDDDRLQSSLDTLEGEIEAPGPGQVHVNHRYNFEQEAAQDHSGTISRWQLLQDLTQIHNTNLRDDLPSHQSNAQFMKLELDPQVLLDTIQQQQGGGEGNYPDGDRWAAWAGEHEGNWYQPQNWANGPNNGVIPDRAVWHQPVDLGGGRSIQPVDFLGNQQFGSNAPRVGFNRTQPGIDHVEGLDPKADLDQQTNYAEGPHQGYTLHLPNEDGNQVEVIVWITGSESFLELVGDVQVDEHTVERRRCSASNNGGHGQWTVNRIPQ